VRGLKKRRFGSFLIFSGITGRGGGIVILNAECRGLSGKNGVR